jgi:hypothetical protein
MGDDRIGNRKCNIRLKKNHLQFKERLIEILFSQYELPFRDEGFDFRKKPSFPGFVSGPVSPILFGGNSPVWRSSGMDSP